MEKILVTGGYGFIGSNFIRYLLKHTDYSVVNIDKVTPQAHPEALRPYHDHPRYLFFKTDICRLDEEFDIFENCNYIVNFAAETHVDRSIGAWEIVGPDSQRWHPDQDDFIFSNILGVQRLLELSRKIKGFKRFIQVSTDEVYGSVKNASFEKDAFNITNPYSATKAAGEHMAMAYYHTFDVPVCITRSCNNYGIWQGSEKLIPLTILRALADKSIPVYGTGDNKRDWIFVEDNVRAILDVMEKGVPGFAYNIPGDNSISNNNLIEKILKLMKKPEYLMVLTKDRPGHDFEYLMDGELLSSTTGWYPHVSLNDGLLETIDFYAFNEQFFNNEMKQNGVLSRVNSLLEASN